jgi:hypothetical protein
MTRKLVYVMSALLLSAGMLLADQPNRGCATRQLDETEAVAIEKQMKKGGGKASVTVPVWVHVLTDGTYGNV